LWERNRNVLRSDKPNLWLTFGQVPIIALLMLMTFWGFRDDSANAESFTRKTYLFSGGTEEARANNQPVDVETQLTQAEQDSATPTRMISLQAARRRGAIYFVLVASSIWFGILGGCREVVAEKHVLRREHKIGLRLPPYLTAKFLIQILQTGLQTATLAILTVPLLLCQPVITTVGIWAGLWLAAASSAALGLMVSCLAPSVRFALTAVPLFMIPQIILGGMLRPEVDASNWAARPPSWLTVQRWSFENVLAMDEYARGDVMLQCFPEDGGRYGALGTLQFRNGTLVECFFVDKARWVSVVLPGCILLLETGLFLGIGCHQLRRQLSMGRD
jgi:hypothetical protein